MKIELFTIIESWKTILKVSIKISSTTVFNIDKKCFRILEWFLKDRVTLKTGVMMLKVQLFKITGINWKIY